MKIRKQIAIAVFGAFVMGGIIGWAISSKNEGGEPDTVHKHDEDAEYTCSMHPQIRQNEPGDCPICGMDLVPVSSLGGDGDSANPYVMTMTPEAIALANISTTTVRSGRGKGAFSVELSGKVEADERKVASVSANFGGRVDELFVAFTGQEVQKGQRLASIYSPELVAAHRELIEAKEAKGISPELYQAAKQKLKQWQLSDKQIAEMEKQESYQAHFDIYANVSGVVSERKIAVGDYVSRGQVLFEITNLNKVWVKLDAYENNIDAIRKGDEISFRANSFPNREFTAKVTFIDPILSSDTRSIKVRAEVDNASGTLKPGMFVTAEIESSSAQKAIEGVLVPGSAILWTGEQSIVYRQVGDASNPAFEMVKVELGPLAGDKQWVLSGLQEGDRVVTNGVFAVDGAAQLSGKYSMMAHPNPQKIEVGEQFGREMDSILDAYLKLKNRLVADESGEELARSLVKEIDQVDVSGLNEEAKEKWSELKEGLSTSAEMIQKEKKLEEQRQAFVHLSNNLIELMDVFGTTKEAVYKSYCPMAKNDQGAFWLSESEEIRNPYFGASMLTCGEVKGIYRSNEISSNQNQTNGRKSGHQH
ncbi:efflux RND transporter periplasmic adaptor subunit [Echinicola sediminis]